MHPSLTEDEIAEITKPLTQGKARIRFFKKLGCKVSAKPNGQPLVGRAEYEATLMGKNHQAPRVGPIHGRVIAVDWDAVRAARKGHSKSAC